METPSSKLSLILYSGTVDKLMAASILASGGVAMDMEVELFITFWGLEAFRKGAHQTNTTISKEFEAFGPAMMAVMQEKQVPTWMDNLRQAKELGNLHVVACSHTMEMFDIKLEDLEDIVDEVVGVASFLASAEDAKVTLFI